MRRSSGQLFKNRDPFIFRHGQCFLRKVHISEPVIQGRQSPHSCLASRKRTYIEKWNELVVTKVRLQARMADFGFTRMLKSSYIWNLAGQLSHAQVYKKHFITPEKEHSLSIYPSRDIELDNLYTLNTCLLPRCCSPPRPLLPSQPFPLSLWPL